MASEVSQKDKADIEKVAPILLKIDKIDAAYVNATSEAIARHQPFLISMLLGDSEMLSPEELEEMMKCYFIIWEYFKDTKGTMSKAIDEDQMDRILKRNLMMVKYMGEEPTEKAKNDLVQGDIEHLSSKALWVAINLRMENRPAFLKMDAGKKSQCSLLLKSLIECFEELG